MFRNPLSGGTLLVVGLLGVAGAAAAVKAQARATAPPGPFADGSCSKLAGDNRVNSWINGVAMPTFRRAEKREPIPVITPEQIAGMTAEQIDALMKSQAIVTLAYLYEIASKLPSRCRGKAPGLHGTLAAQELMGRVTCVVLRDLHQRNLLASEEADDIIEICSAPLKTWEGVQALGEAMNMPSPL